MQGAACSRCGAQVGASLWLASDQCQAQSMGGVYDFGLGRRGEKRGDWTPGEWLAAILLVMVIFLGLALSLSLCYYVWRRKTRVTSSMISGRAWSSQRSAQQQQQQQYMRNQLMSSDEPSSKEPSSILVAHI